MTELEAKAWLSDRYPLAAIERLELLVRLLVQEAQHQNLIAASTVTEIWSRHIVDSAQLLQHVPDGHLGPWLDIGSGAGLPGMVVAALDPERRMVLVEPRKRRVEWLHAAVDALELDSVTIFATKIERVEPFGAGVITARAVMALKPLIASATAFSTRETLWLLPKGASARQDLSQLGAKEQKMFHVEQSITDRNAQIIVGHGSVPGRNA